MVFRKKYPFFVGLGVKFFSIVHPGDDQHNHEIDPATGIGDCEQCAVGRPVPAPAPEEARPEPEPDPTPAVVAPEAPAGTVVGEGLAAVLAATTTTPKESQRGGYSAT